MIRPNSLDKIKGHLPAKKGYEVIWERAAQRKEQEVAFQAECSPDGLFWLRLLLLDQLIN